MHAAAVADRNNRLCVVDCVQVCNYPFTTRSIKMGHFYIDANRHQVRASRV